MKKTEIEAPEKTENKNPEREKVVVEKKSDIVSLFKNGVTILRSQNDAQKYLQEGWTVK